MTAGRCPLHRIPYQEYCGRMPREVEYADEFERWWQTPPEGWRRAAAARVELPAGHGPGAPFPHSPDIGASREGVMRGPRTQGGGRLPQVSHAPDPGQDLDTAHRRSRDGQRRSCEECA